LRVWKSNSGWW
jgi:hypothetical protein